MTRKNILNDIQQHLLEIHRALELEHILGGEVKLPPSRRKCKILTCTTPFIFHFYRRSLSFSHSKTMEFSINLICALHITAFNYPFSKITKIINHKK